MTREHTLVIEPDTEYNNRHPDWAPEFKYHVECASQDECGGWMECREDHGVADADDYADEDDREFHGEMHTWTSSWGWTVPFKGCVVAHGLTGIPDEIHPIRSGRWIIDDDWDGDECYIIVVREVTA